MILPARAERLSGGDISLLPEYEQAGAKYRTASGQAISDLIVYSAEQGMNAMRVRLFVNPENYHGSDADPNACQDLDYILPLCKRIKDAGLKLMLDFHYSDTWADPAKQYTPADWKDLSDQKLYEQIYNYTKEVLQTLKDNGAAPDLIQTGNEISYGMLWGPEGTPAADRKTCYMGSQKNWSRFASCLKMAVEACREVCPDAKVIIHTERVPAQSVLKNFYEQMAAYQVDYDIIGLSYYPYWHGDMSVLDGSLSMLEQNFPTKPIMIVETGYPYKWAVPGSDHDMTSIWAYSNSGQNKFMTDLIATANTHPNVQGIFWWWMEYNAYGTSLSGWYNAPLFDSTTGKATSAFKTLASYASSSSVDTLPGLEEEERGPWFDLCGRQVSEPLPPGIYVRRGEKRIVR